MKFRKIRSFYPSFRYDGIYCGEVEASILDWKRKNYFLILFPRELLNLGLKISLKEISAEDFPLDKILLKQYFCSLWSLYNIPFNLNILPEEINI